MACITALFMAFGWCMEGSRPSCSVCRISKVGLNSVGEGDRRENVVWGSEDAPRWCVGWVMLAGNISCVEMCSCSLDDVMNSSEDGVGLGVLAGAFPPSFDDPCIVSIALEMRVGAIEL